MGRSQVEVISTRSHDEFRNGLMGLPTSRLQTVPGFLSKRSQSWAARPRSGHSRSTQREPAGSCIGKEGADWWFFVAMIWWAWLFSEVFRKDPPVPSHVVFEFGGVHNFEPTPCRPAKRPVKVMCFRNVLGKQFWYQSLVQGFRIWRGNALKNYAVGIC